MRYLLVVRPPYRSANEEVDDASYILINLFDEQRGEIKIQARRAARMAGRCSCLEKLTYDYEKENTI